MFFYLKMVKRLVYLVEIYPIFFGNAHIESVFYVFQNFNEKDLCLAFFVVISRVQMYW